MSKKKIAALLISGVLAIGIVGGSLAWFTAKDSVTNPFSTGATDDPNKPLSGVKILEPNFDKDRAQNLLPGDTLIKDVKVQNTANYDSFIRVKLTTVIKDLNQKTVSDEIAKKFTLNLTESNVNEKWVKGSDNYYYYIGKVKKHGSKENGKETDITEQLLDSVTLDGTAGNECKNLKFDVIVDAESIQASNNAVDSWGASTEIATQLKALQK